MSKDLYLQNKTSFYTNAMNILKSYKHETPDLVSITNISVKSIITNIKETYSNVWKNEINHSSKLEFYSTFKQEFCLEKYLSTIKNTNQRKSFTRFHISNHNLMVEHGSPKILHVKREYASYVIQM